MTCDPLNDAFHTFGIDEGVAVTINVLRHNKRVEEHGEDYDCEVPIATHCKCGKWYHGMLAGACWCTEK